MITEELTATLSSFKTAEEVRVACQAAGVKGIPNDVNYCVIANLLKKRFPDNVIKIYQEEAIFLEKYTGLLTIVPLSEQWQAAAKSFDNGEWPELVA